MMAERMVYSNSQGGQSEPYQWCAITHVRRMYITLILNKTLDSLCWCLTLY